MEFRFHPDIFDLRDAARAFLDGENGPERLRGLTSGGDPLGLSGAEQMLLCEEVGRAGLPEPFSDVAAVLIPALALLGGQASGRIAALCSGQVRGGLVHPLLPFANHAGGAGFILHFASGQVILAESGQFACEVRTSIDPGRMLSRLEPTGGETVMEGEAADHLQEQVALRGAVAAAAELCGLAERMIRLATEYSRTRTQFGQPIGSFQAVKHLMANAQVRLEFARPVVYRAGALLGCDGPAVRLAAAHAKIAAGDAAMLAAENAIQVFGGMGYTFEVDLHFFMKRTWALVGLWGDRNHHMKIVDDSVFGSPDSVGPGTTFA